MFEEISNSLKDIKSELMAGNISGVITQYSDIVMAGLILMILTLMILPIPTFFLSFLIVANLTLAFAI
ncbi:MAG: hypothetical protein JNN15_21210, partial [Blastocatellia bacterium]|nr:hypothetical protein [Blastocatellia bacterium]